MTNVLLNIYEFQADWAKSVLGEILKPELKSKVSASRKLRKSS